MNDNQEPETRIYTVERVIIQRADIEAEKPEFAQLKAIEDPADHHWELIGTIAMKVIKASIKQ